MKMLKLLTLGWIAILWAGPVEEGTSIAKKADGLTRGYGNEKYESTMILIDAQGRTVERHMISLNLERADQEDYSIIQFLNPADVRGTGLLTHQNPKGDDQQWLYLPELRRVKKISSSNKSGAFMGSEFSYEDISANSFAKWNYKLLESNQIDGEDCWIIERIPNYKNSGYSKTKIFVRKKDNLVIRTEFFDRKGLLLKIQTIGKFTKVGKAMRFGEITMENLQTGKKSLLKIGKRQQDDKIKESDFNQRTLKRPLRM